MVSGASLLSGSSLCTFFAHRPFAQMRAASSVTSMRLLDYSLRKACQGAIMSFADTGSEEQNGSTRNDFKKKNGMKKRFHDKDRFQGRDHTRSASRSDKDGERSCSDRNRYSPA